MASGQSFTGETHVQESRSTSQLDSDSEPLPEPEPGFIERERQISKLALLLCIVRFFKRTVFYRSQSGTGSALSTLASSSPCTAGPTKKKRSSSRERSASGFLSTRVLEYLSSSYCFFTTSFALAVPVTVMMQKRLT